MKTIAHWITVCEERKENLTFLARRAFDLEAVPASVCLQIAADSRYVLYLNGQFIGNGPAKGSHRRYFYDTFEVAPFLRVGTNHIGVEVHSPGRSTFCAVPLIPAVFLDLKEIVATDPQWQVRVDPSHRRNSLQYTPQTGFSDFRDLRKEIIGWREFLDGSEGWSHAVTIEEFPAPGGRQMTPRDIPTLSRKKYHPAALISSGNVPAADEKSIDDPAFAELMQREPHFRYDSAVQMENGQLRFESNGSGDVYCIIDFERETLGSILIDIEAHEGAILDVGYGDAVYQGRVKTYSAPYRFADRYILREGRQCIAHYLHDRGFRYIQLVLRRTGNDIQVHSICSESCSYPLLNAATFESDDPFLNRLWQMCADTIMVCTTDTFIDCPWREQSFWVNDTLTVFPFYLAFTNEVLLPARCLRLAADGQRKNGLIPSVYPSAEVKHSTFPSMSAIWTLMLADYYLYTGDTDLVRELLPAMEGALSIYKSWSNADGLIWDQPEMWNFIEWASPGSGGDQQTNGATSILNVLIAAAYRAAAFLYEAAGDIPRRNMYQACQRDLVAKILEVFLIPSKMLLRDNIQGPVTFSQHPHAAGLYYDLFPDSLRRPIMAALLDANVVSADFYFQHFTISALSRGGFSVDAIASIRKLWGEMVSKEWPTTWETTRGKEEFGGVGSMCHAFSCAPLYFIQSVVIGIRPLLPAFREFLFDPQSLDLQFAKGRIPTPHGFITVSWTKQSKGTLRAEIDVPMNTEAVLRSGARLPSGRHTLIL